MPYLSWTDGTVLQRYALSGTIQVGRDPGQCALVCAPSMGTVSRVHAAVQHFKDGWWIKDLGSAQGTKVNGLPTNQPLGNRLVAGDEILLGEWALTFSEGFPGLDSERFAERVGSLLEELKPDPSHTLLMVRSIELMHHATEKLLAETDADSLLRTLLDKGLELFLADRGFLVMLNADGTRRTAHRVGEVHEGIGLSRSVLDYVAQERVGILSNEPLADPRFGSISLLEFHRGSLMCAPLLDAEELRGFIYLDREQGRRPFTRFDLALFQTFVRQSVLALRLTLLSRQALGQAEASGELLRVKASQEREREEHAELMQAMARPVRWLQAWSRDFPGPAAAAFRQHLQQLMDLVEHGQNFSLRQPAPAAGHPWRMEQLQEDLASRWTDLLQVSGIQAQWSPAPQGSVWVGAGPVLPALVSLVEPLILASPKDSTLTFGWSVGRGTQTLRATFAPGLTAPVPDPWTRRVLTEASVRWRWADQVLHLEFNEGPDALPEEPERPLLGLVAKDLSLLGLFQSAAEAGDLALFPLEEDPPLPGLPRFRMLVIDVTGLRDPRGCVRAYRQHPSFTTTPILLVRVKEEEASELTAVGATDWLQDGFRWEALHHRLQVLRGHQELQERALQAERLDTFRQTAGTLKHEINNPLAVISMQVEMLQRKYPEEVKLAKIGEMVERIRGLVGVLQKMREMKLEDYADGSSIMKVN
jgi:pSer/pThr/pTyr-binding forkhead associated (FHA) protein